MIGSETGAHSITVGNDDGTTLEVTQPLTVRAPAEGGQIELTGSISGVSLQVQGPGETADPNDGTTLTSTVVTTTGDIDFQDSVTVSGTSSLTAGTSGTGSVTISGNVDGTGAADDVLVVAAEGGNVQIRGTVGGTTPLAGLVVTDAVDVTFDQPVTIDGDFVLDATPEEIAKAMFAAGDKLSTTSSRR